MDMLPPVVPFYHTVPIREINGVLVLPAPNWYRGGDARAESFPQAKPILAEYRISTIQPILAPASEPSPGEAAQTNLDGQPSEPAIAISNQASPNKPTLDTSMSRYRKLIRK